jgi:SAM-dependent methyltransferase
MSELSLQQLEATATAYEQRLVPALFAAWTQPILDLAEIGDGDRVLDVACGTGVLARAVAAGVGSGGTVTGLDLNPGMLAVAERLAPAIKWRQGEASKLPFEDQAFDAVVSQFGLMFFPDREAALREMVRVLSPGGRLVLAVFDNLENNPGYAAMVSVFERQVSKEVGEALRFPFVLGDRAQLLSLFNAAGITTAVASSAEMPARFPSVSEMVLADVKGWFPLAGINLDEATIESVVNDAQDALASFVDLDGAVQFPAHALIVTASKA